MERREKVALATSTMKKNIDWIVGAATWILTGILVWKAWPEMYAIAINVGAMFAAASFAVGISAGITIAKRRWKVALGILGIVLITAHIFGFFAARAAIVSWDCRKIVFPAHRFLGAQTVCASLLAHIPMRTGIMLLWWGVTAAAAIIAWEYAWERTKSKLVAWLSAMSLFFLPTVLGTASMEMTPFAILAVLAAMYYENKHGLMRYLAIGGGGYFRPVVAIFAPIFDALTRNWKAHKGKIPGAIIFGIATGIELGAFLYYTFTVGDQTIINDGSVFSQIMTNIVTNSQRMISKTNPLQAPAQIFFISAAIITIADVLVKRTLPRELLLGWAIFLAYFTFHPDGPLKWYTYAPISTAFISMGAIIGGKSVKEVMLRAIVLFAIPLAMLPGTVKMLHGFPYGAIHAEQAQEIRKISIEHNCTPVVVDVLARSYTNGAYVQDTKVYDAAIYFDLPGEPYAVVHIINRGIGNFAVTRFPVDALPEGNCYIFAFERGDVRTEDIFGDANVTVKVIGGYSNNIIGGIIWK